MIKTKPLYQWFAVYTKANNEKKIYSRLIENNIECYLPTRKILKFWSDRKKWMDEPIFRSYIFVKVSNREFFNVLNMPGIVCFVSFGGKAQVIPEIQINNLKHLVRQTQEEITLTYQNIRKGQKAQVLYGKLKGLEGEIVEIHGQNRLLIRMDIMNCSLHVKISKEEVRIIDKSTQLYAIP